MKGKKTMTIPKNLQQNTSESTSERLRHLKPFAPGESRTRILARKGGSKATSRKRLAATIRELKKKHPEASRTINSLVKVLTNLDLFTEHAVTELIELLLLKEDALQSAPSAEARYKIQRDYLMTVLQIGTVFYDKEDMAKQRKTSDKPTVFDAIQMVMKEIKQKRENEEPLNPDSQGQILPHPQE